jgi:hypothetical protein
VPSCVIPLIVGLASGLFGTLATITHERGAEFRTRMLSAADEFLQVTGKITVQIRDAKTAASKPKPTAEELKPHIAALKDARSDLVTQGIPRIQLLFGEKSRAWDRVLEADTALEGFIGAIESRLPSSGLHASDYLVKKCIESWVESIGNFGGAARTDVRRSRKLRRVAHD